MENKGFIMPITRVVVVSGHSSCMFTEYEDVPMLPIPSGINVITLCSLNDELLTATNAPFRGLEILMSNPGVTVTLGGVVDLFKEKRKLRIINPATETSIERSIGVAYSGEQGTPQFFFGGRPNVQLVNEGIFCWDSSSGGGMTDISLDLLTENQGLLPLTPLQMEIMKLERTGVIREPSDLRGSFMTVRDEKKKQSGVGVVVEDAQNFYNEYKILNENRIKYLESIGFNRSQAADYVEENKMDLPIYYLEQMRKSILRWEKTNQKFVFENIEEFIRSDESERMFVELELEELGGVTEENIRKYIMFLSESTMNQMNQMKKQRETYGYFGGDFRLVPSRFREIESGVLLELLHEKYPKGNTAVVYVGCRKCRNKDPGDPPCQSPRGAKCRVGGKLIIGRRRIKKTMKKKQIKTKYKKKGKTIKK